MRKLIAGTAVLALSAGLAWADDHGGEGPSDEVVDEIMTMLEGMNCEMDPDDIEVEEDGGYDLDDVICQDEGQMDIKLDADLNEVDRRLE